MEDENKDIQVLNGNDGEPSGDEQHQYSDTEKQLYARLKKEEALRKELEAKIGKDNSGKQINSSDIEWRERMEIKLEHGIKDDTELDFIMKNGGKEAFNNPLVKIAIDRKREESVAEEKVAMNVSSKSAIERKYSPQELQAMSADEMEAVLTGRKR